MHVRVARAPPPAAVAFALAFGLAVALFLFQPKSSSPGGLKKVTSRTIAPSAYRKYKKDCHPERSNRFAETKQLRSRRTSTPSTAVSHLLLCWFTHIPRLAPDTISQRNERKIALMQGLSQHNSSPQRLNSHFLLSRFLKEMRRRNKSKD